MKDLNYYMSLPYRVDYEFEPLDNSWIAFIPILGRGACYSIGNTKEEALERLTEIKKGLIELLLSEGDKIPEPMKLYSIKPLEWKEDTPLHLQCKTGGGYYISFVRETSKWQVYGGLIDLLDIPSFDAIDEAKSKAQEDWNNRISQYLTEYKLPDFDFKNVDPEIASALNDYEIKKGKREPSKPRFNKEAK